MRYSPGSGILPASSPRSPGTLCPRSWADTLTVMRCSARPTPTIAADLLRHTRRHCARGIPASLNSFDGVGALECSAHDPMVVDLDHSGDRDPCIWFVGEQSVCIR